MTDFIDLAVPVFNDDETLGVLGAVWDWAEEVKDTLLGSMKNSIHADVIVLNDKKQILSVRTISPAKSWIFRASTMRARGLRVSRSNNGRTGNRTSPDFPRATATGRIRACIGSC